MKTFPSKGNYVRVDYLTDFLIPQTFYGKCISTHWAGFASTITIYNTANGFKQKFFFFSPLVTFVGGSSLRLKTRR